MDSHALQLVLEYCPFDPELLQQKFCSSGRPSGKSHHSFEDGNNALNVFQSEVQKAHSAQTVHGTFSTLHTVHKQATMHNCEKKIGILSSSPFL